MGNEYPSSLARLLLILIVLSNLNDGSAIGAAALEKPKGRHFVLVHGAAHGAWCWYKVSSLLESAGHNVTALDMKASGVNPSNEDDVASLLDYSAPLLHFIRSLPPEEKVVLVGHSSGGYSISAAMERYPHKISVAVFLSAAMISPSPSSLSNEKSNQISLNSFNRIIAAFHVPQPVFQYHYGNGLKNPATAVLFSPAFYKLVYYRRSPPEDYELGRALWRYFPNKAEDITGLNLTEKNYGSVRRVYIICDPETAMDWQKAYIHGYPPEDVVTLPGSDHMAMFSQTKALVTSLQNIGAKYH